MHIDNLAVEPIHAKIHFRNHKAIISLPHKDFKLLINNKIPSWETAVEIKHGDEIQIGKHTITYLWENKFAQGEGNIDTPSRKENTLNGWLQIMSGPRLGRTLQLNKPKLSIGPEGKKGALITNTSDGYFLAHLDNTLPVRVNNQDVGDNRIHLQTGQTIKVGDMEMLFYTQD